MPPRLALALVLVGGQAESTGSCKSEADCGYLGACMPDGSCRCDPPWAGPECQRLTLAPVAPDLASGFHQRTTASWGGPVLRGDDGRVYMYASEITEHCGIGAWTRNSRIVLASADNITAPFAFDKELWPVFSHEPAATRAPTGEYVVFFTTTAYGCGAHGPCVPPVYCPGGNETGCHPGGPLCAGRCTSGETVPSCFDIDQDHRGRPSIRFPTFMAWSNHPGGPFSTPVMIFNGTDRDPANKTAGATGDTNMDVVIFADGSVAGLWRGSRYPDPAQFQYPVFAGHWKDPASYVFGAAVKANNIFPGLAGSGDSNCAIEDPTVFLDTHGRMHALFHNYRAGGHAASADRGRTWRWYGGKCGCPDHTTNCSRGTNDGNVVDWTRSVWPPQVEVAGGGPPIVPHRRERPHVVMAADGYTVEALSTATQNVGPPHDHTWTMVQPTQLTQPMVHSR